MKNVANILKALSENLPEPLFNCLSDLLGLFDMKAYILRNSLVNILANFVIKKLSNLDNVEDPQ